jgi:predicted O-methyltransferase YrrM
MIVGWIDFYNSVKDSSWPECNTIEQFPNLPPNIQLEIVQDHLFERQLPPVNQYSYSGSDLPEFLNYIEQIKNIIGPEYCLMNSQDVIFLYSMIWSKQPQNVLEIGRLHGYSTAIIYGGLEDSNHGHLYTIDIVDRTNQQIRELVNSRTTFITDDSGNLLIRNDIASVKFDLAFIDGDHNYQTTLSDLSKCYQITASEAWILVHDNDLLSVKQSIAEFVRIHPNVVDCGGYGEKIQLLYKKEKI